MRLRPGPLAVVLSALLGPSTAFAAWHEAHLAGDEARVRVDSHGLASVEHILKWRVVHGPLKSIDLSGVDPSAVLEPTATIRTEDGHDLTGQVVRGDDAVVHVIPDAPQSLTRGVATFDVRWQVDLVATHAIVLDGESWRLSWSLPAAVNGFDLPRISIDLPSAPEPPRSLGGDLSAPEQGSGETDTLKREGDRDILEIVRPYAAHGESISGSIRLDPRALPEVTDPSLRPPAAPVASGSPRQTRGEGWAWALGFLGIAFGFLVASRERAFGVACANGGRSVRGLVPLPGLPRAALAGAALAAGVILQVVGQPLAAGALIAVSVLCSALRACRGVPVARGPGQWFPVRPEEVFGTGRPSWLVELPWRGGLVAVAILVAAWVAGRFGPQGPWLVLTDCAPLVALLATGHRSQLPSVDLMAAGRLLRRTFVRLKRIRSLSVMAWGRVSLDGTIDELRIRVLPRAPVPGLVGIEIGHAWSPTPVGWAPGPEVLVRVLEGSAAAARLAQALPDSRPISGRRAQERVRRLTPLVPTDRECLALVRHTADALTDRRVGSDSLRQPDVERRKPLPGSGAPCESRDWPRSVLEATC